MPDTPAPTQPNVQNGITAIFRNITSVIRGKDDVVELALITLLARGHLLLEDIPGVGKTMLGLALSRSIKCPFRRIQFTNDTVPADILGMMVYSRKEEKFRFVAGPIFAGVVLADEINRTSPKTQSALLEAMTERKVSIENRAYRLPDPFMVIATQNPLEFHGTFPLPESQLDRFMLRTRLGYPDNEAEREILSQDIGPDKIRELPAVVDCKGIAEARKMVETVKIESSVLDYLLSLIDATRREPRLALAVSPRGSLALKRAAQARAYLKGRAYVLPDDIKRLALPVWGHRVVAKTNGATGTVDRFEVDGILQDILDRTPVPV